MSFLPHLLMPENKEIAEDRYWQYGMIFTWLQVVPCGLAILISYPLIMTTALHCDQASML